MEFTIKFVCTFLTSWFPTLILYFVYTTSFLSISDTSVTIAMLSRVPSVAHFCHTISDKHHKDQLHCHDNREPMGEPPFFISKTSTSHTAAILCFSSQLWKLNCRILWWLQFHDESLCSSLLTFLKLQIPSSLRIGPEVTIKIANVFRKESYIELCPAAKVHFATLKAFSVFLILQSRFPLNSIKWMGWMMGKRQW